LYIDFEDHRPDVPRVPQGLRTPGGVVASIAVHVLGVLAILFFPTAWLASQASPVVVTPSADAVRYVHIVPRVEAPAPPKRPADVSDLDRRSATVERAPKPANTDPFSRGNTPERIDGRNGERTMPVEPPAAAPPANATAAAAAPTAPPTVSPNGVVPIPAPEKPLAPGLAASIRNLQQYFRSQNFDNQQGGETDANTDIQFDSKGVDFGPWLRRFKVLVEQNWFIPQAALVSRGRVVLQFNVWRDGRITDLKIVQAATVTPLTSSAVNAIQRSNPTPPLPAEYPLDHAFFTVTFHYNER
jgi:TonB family protein